MVKFACVCEHCSTRGPEYEMFGYCRECGDQVCGQCEIVGEHDHETGKTLCRSCDAELHSPTARMMLAERDKP